MMKPVLLLTLLVLILFVFVLVGCESPAAQREQARADRIRAEGQAYEREEQARADRIRAEGQAYEREKQADAAYNTQVTLNRQYERDASHERTMESMPFVLAIGGGVLVLVLVLVLIGTWIAWQSIQVKRAQPSTDVAIYDGSQELAQRVDRMERGFYGLIIALQRQQGGHWQPPTKEAWQYEMPIVKKVEQPWA